MNLRNVWPIGPACKTNSQSPCSGTALRGQQRGCPEVPLFRLKLGLSAWYWHWLVTWCCPIHPTSLRSDESSPDNTLPQGYRHGCASQRQAGFHLLAAWWCLVSSPFQWEKNKDFCFCFCTREHSAREGSRGRSISHWHDKTWTLRLKTQR